jgi:ABC-type transport system involved in Fe-S cluster assembly fused permease/ATPase subunit
MEKISASMWFLRILIIIRVTVALVFLFIDLKRGIFIIVENSFYFILYFITLIGLFKKYNWAFLLIIGITILDYIITIIEISSWEFPLEGILNPAFYFGILIIIMAIYEYKKSKKVVQNKDISNSSSQ